MTFLIITQVSHTKQENQYFSYAPYIREMNIWLKYVTKVIIVAPLEKAELSQIHLAYKHENIQFIPIETFDITNVKSVIKTFAKLPKIIYKIVDACLKTNHIHLRCPGNVGLLGCIVQIFFPNTAKTAKYAGNWDAESKQTFTYKLQQFILNNTFLTRNMKVLVYGKWQGTSKNIKPFFTATYYESDKTEIVQIPLTQVVKFVFVGTLVTGKNAMYAIQLIAFLLINKFQVQLDIYGDGNQKLVLEDFILKNNLQNHVILHGNQNSDTLKKAYQDSHFVILPSESEGWPKAIAEGMFWGCVPIATPVSCVPYMLNFGKRGLLLDLNLENDAQKMQHLLADAEKYNLMSNSASLWSRKYTLDYFEAEIKLLLQP